MSFNNWLYFVLTVLVLMSTPGPSHLLMLSNSMQYGTRRALATAAGDLSANLLQMLAAALGLAALLRSSERALLVIKWLGVAYLLWLAIQMLRRSFARLAAIDSTKAVGSSTLWLQGFVTSGANPKAVVFFAAFFPLFIHAQQPFWPQFITLALTYLVIDGLFLSAYGLGAAWLARHLQGNNRLWLARVSAVLIIVAALALGARTLPAS